MQRDTLTITKVDWPSPMWDAGIRSSAKVLLIAGKPATIAAMDQLKSSVGTTLSCTLLQDGKRLDVPVISAKKNRPFIFHIPAP